MSDEARRASDAGEGSFDDGTDRTLPSPVLGPMSEADGAAHAPAAASHPPQRQAALRRLMLASIAIAAALAIAAVVYRMAAVSDRNSADRALADVRAQLDLEHKARDHAAAQKTAATARVERATATVASAKATAARVAARSTAARAAGQTVLDSSAAETQLSTVQEQALRDGRFTDYNASRNLYNATYGAPNGPYAQQIAALERLVRALTAP